MKTSESCILVLMERGTRNGNDYMSGMQETNVITSSYLSTLWMVKKKAKERYWILGSCFRNNCSRSSNVIRLNCLVVSGCLVGYSLNTFVLRDVLNNVFLKSYGNDVIAGFLILAIINLILVKSKYTITVDTYWMMIRVLVLIGLFWEYISPTYKAVSTSDAKDIVAYLCGGVLYISIIKLHMKQKQKRNEG